MYLVRYCFVLLPKSEYLPSPFCNKNLSRPLIIYHDATDSMLYILIMVDLQNRIFLFLL